MGRRRDDEIWIPVESLEAWTMQYLTNQDDPVANLALVRTILMGRDRWLKPKEAAQALGVSVPQLEALVDQGMVQALRLAWANPADQLRIPESAVRGGGRVS